MKIIGIAGAARAGKDSLGRVLCENSDPRFPLLRGAFADELKREIFDFIWGNFKIDIFTCTNEEKTIIRPLLIGHGEARRAQNPDYWVKKLFENLSETVETWIDGRSETVVVQGYCITDVRYLNEARYIQKEGGKIVFLERAGNEPTFKEKETLPVVEEIADLKIRASNFDSEVMTLKYFHDLLNSGGLDGVL